MGCACAQKNALRKMHLSKSQSEIVQLAEVIHISADATERTHSGMIEGECRDGTSYIKLIIIYIYFFRLFRDRVDREKAIEKQINDLVCGTVHSAASFVRSMPCSNDRFYYKIAETDRKKEQNEHGVERANAVDTKNPNINDELIQYM